MKHLLIIPVIALAACAQPPSMVKPADVTTNESCDKLPALRDELAALSKEQREVVTTDAITSSLFLLPAASMAGASKAKEIASVKGRIAFLEVKCQ